MGGPAFAMMVGPGEAPLAVDTLRLTRHLFPDAPVYVRDDATTDGTAQALARWAEGDQHAHVSRNGHARGYLGLAKSSFTLFRDLSRDPGFAGCDALVKIDPDAAIASRSLGRVVADAFARRGPGILGAVSTGPSGGHREHGRAARNVHLDLLPVGPSKTSRWLRTGRPFWVQALRAARRHGYVIGVGVQGGTFALAAESLHALRESGYLDAIPEDYAAMTYEEDFLYAIGVVSLGHGLHELADTPAQWWVQHRPPVPLTPQQVHDGDHVMIHPLKDDPAGWALRDALADRHGLARSTR